MPIYQSILCYIFFNFISGCLTPKTTLYFTVFQERILRAKKLQRIFEKKTSQIPERRRRCRPWWAVFLDTRSARTRSLWDRQTAPRSSWSAHPPASSLHLDVRLSSAADSRRWTLESVGRLATSRNRSAESDSGHWPASASVRRACESDSGSCIPAESPRSSCLKHWPKYRSRWLAPAAGLAVSLCFNKHTQIHSDVNKATTPKAKAKAMIFKAKA